MPTSKKSKSPRPCSSYKQRKSCEQRPDCQMHGSKCRRKPGKLPYEGPHAAPTRKRAASLQSKKKRAPSAYNTFVSVKLRDPKFYPKLPHKERFAKAAHAWPAHRDKSAKASKAKGRK